MLAASSRIAHENHTSYDESPSTNGNSATDTGKQSIPNAGRLVYLCEVFQMNCLHRVYDGRWGRLDGIGICCFGGAMYKGTRFAMLFLIRIARQSFEGLYFYVVSTRFPPVIGHDLGNVCSGRVVY